MFSIITSAPNENSGHSFSVSSPAALSNHGTVFFHIFIY